MAVFKQLFEGSEGTLFGRQGAVVRIELPSSHLRQHGAGMGHPTIAAVFGLLVSKFALIINIKAIGGVAGRTHNYGQLVSPTGQILITLLAELLPEAHGLGQHLVIGDSPAGVVKLAPILVPPAAGADLVEIAIGQFLPALLGVEALGTIQQAGL